ncbi:hypothetical protein FKW77_007527 [Venturia effusa]|uniref:Transcription elongation factor Eaf N-terminal domain-containing protein n=1 Tax=Venturia effusa TaxID=50376 RepID=A0A517L5S7_9PEZI|nr:hypothetical protein FKW77_007527 [Venturia effusa]
MASPVVAASSNAPLDPKQQGRYALQLGKGITDRSAASSFNAVRFNHKSLHDKGKRSTRITIRNDTQSDLTITDTSSEEVDQFKYAGQLGSTKNSYVLIFDQSKQACTLEPLASSHTFNITATPWGTSLAKLKQEYPQLQAKVEEAVNEPDGDLDEDPDGEADADNPYDFRHYLTSAIRGPSPSPSPALRAVNAGKTTPQALQTQPKPVSEAKPRKKAASKAYDPLRPNQRKPKAATTGANKAKANPTPTIKLDRRASARPGDENKKGSTLSKGNVKSDYYVHSSDEEEEPPMSQPVHSDIEEEDESGSRGRGLEIDFGDDSPPKKSNKILPPKPGGPISLNSAVNSPDRRLDPGAARRQQQKEPSDIIDFGDSSDNFQDDEESDAEESVQKRKQDHSVDMHDADADADADSDVDADADSDHDDDIEPMHLGSPAHQQPPTIEDDDDGDDFEAEMLQAMQDDDGEAESEEESEAE